MAITWSPSGGSGLTGKSGRKTANACDKSARDAITNTAAHFMFVVTNAVTEGLPSVCSRVATLRDNLLPLTRGFACFLGQLLAYWLCCQPTAGRFVLAEAPLSGGKSCSC